MASSSKSPAPFVRRFTRQSRQERIGPEIQLGELEQQDEQLGELDEHVEDAEYDAEHENNRLREEIQQLKERLNTEQIRTRSISPAVSNVSTAVIPLGDLAKEFMRMIPRYDSKRGIQKLLEFVDNFEDFVTNTDLLPETELTVATAKLTGDAKM